LIQVKRYEKKLTLWKLSQKMGITTASIRAWEEGANQPDSKQMALLTKYLGFELANLPIHPDI
jgi:DNA-binding transcriptional regulator YiaG